MQVHEITLSEANPARAAVQTGLAQRAQKRNAPVQQPAQRTGQPAQQPAQPQDPWAERFRAMQKEYPDMPAWQQALALKTAKMLRPGGPLPNKPAQPAAPQVTQAQWDTTLRQVQNQYPGLTPQQYQAAVQKRLGVVGPSSQAQPAQPQPLKPQPTAPQQPAQIAQPAEQYPPITMGSGPKAQVYVWKGNGYVDNKTGKTMDPGLQAAYLKAMKK